jgi:hypothetical protein
MEEINAERKRRFVRVMLSSDGARIGTAIRGYSQ